MPLYQYKCRDCEESFERRLPMARSGEAQPCPTCGSDDTRKLLGAFAVSSSTPARRASVQSSPSPFT